MGMVARHHYAKIILLHPFTQSRDTVLKKPVPYPLGLVPSFNGIMSVRPFEPDHSSQLPATQSRTFLSS